MKCIPTLPIHTRIAKMMTFVTLGIVMGDIIK